MSLHCYVQMKAATMLTQAQQAQDTATSLQLIDAMSQILNGATVLGSTGCNSTSANGTDDALRNAFLKTLAGIANSSSMDAGTAEQIVNSLAQLTNNQGSMDDAQWD